MQLCHGALAGPFLSMGDAAKVWEVSKAVEPLSRIPPALRHAITAPFQPGGAYQTSPT